MHRRDPWVNAVWAKIIEPSRLGHFDLPESTAERVRVADVLREHLAATREERDRVADTRAVQQRVSDAILAAARAGKDFPTAEPIMKARAKAERLDIEVGLIGDHLVGAEPIQPDFDGMNECLKASLADVMQRVAELVPTLEGMNFEEAVVAARGDKAEREAWNEMIRQTERHAAIRSAQRVMHEWSTVGWPNLNSPDELWLDLANVDEVFPNYLPVAGFGAAPTPPWPTDRIRHLAWLVTSAARPWVPSDDELRQTFERVRKQRQSALAGVRTG
jgi:hypothetical protein